MKNSVIIFCLLVAFGCDNGSNDTLLQKLDFGDFTMLVPPTWHYTSLAGVDSSVGVIEVNPAEKLNFDYGLYANCLNVDKVTHDITYAVIGGRGAKIVRPRNAGQGFTGIYFENIDGSDGDKRLTMSVLNVQADTETALITSFRTLRFK
jgi:hypothetical protein